jgi:hypothetical protein
VALESLAGVDLSAGDEPDPNMEPREFSEAWPQRSFGRPLDIGTHVDVRYPSGAGWLAVVQRA